MRRNRKPATRYHHGDLRDALLVETLRFIEQRGLDELSLRVLARRLGVSPAAPYHHFRDRNELLRALATQLWDRFLAQMLEERERAGKDALERLRAIGRVYLHSAALHPAHLRLMFHRDWGPDPEAEPGGEAFRVLRQAVVDCLVQAGRGGEDPMPWVLAMWGGVHGIAAICFDGPLAGSEPDRVEALAEQALGALAHALEP